MYDSRGQLMSYLVHIWNAHWFRPLNCHHLTVQCGKDKKKKKKKNKKGGKKGGKKKSKEKKEKRLKKAQEKLAKEKSRQEQKDLKDLFNKAKKARCVSADLGLGI